MGPPAMVLLPVEGRAETAMGTEYAVIYKRSEGKVVKKVGEVLPHPRSAVNSEAFVVETVYLQSPPLLINTGAAPTSSHLICLFTTK